MNFKNLNEAFENKFSVSRSLLREEREQEKSRQLSKKRFLESIDRTLTEKHWKFTIPGTFRNAIFDAGDEEDYEGVRQALVSICEYVVDNIKESEFDADEQEEIAEEFADFIEELEYMDFEDEDEANYYLNDLYDLLDNTDIFLGLRESLNERDNFKKRLKKSFNESVEVADSGEEPYLYFDEVEGLDAVEDFEGGIVGAPQNLGDAPFKRFSDIDMYYYATANGEDVGDLSSEVPRNIKSQFVKACNNYASDHPVAEVEKEEDEWSDEGEYVLFWVEGLHDRASFDDVLDEFYELKERIKDLNDEEEAVLQVIDFCDEYDLNDSFISEMIDTPSTNRDKLRQILYKAFPFPYLNTWTDSEVLGISTYQCSNSYGLPDSTLKFNSEEDAIRFFKDKCGEDRKRWDEYDYRVDVCVARVPRSAAKKNLLNDRNCEELWGLGTVFFRNYEMKNESLREAGGQIDSAIKEKVIKKFNQEISKSDIDHSIDEDGYGFHITRKDGSKLSYDASTGKMEFTPVKKLGEGKITGGSMPPKDVATIEPLINDFDRIEETNKDILYITWSFGRRLSDNKMTAGVDISTYRRKSEESLDMYLEAMENAIQKNGFKFDDSLGYDSEHWRKHAFGDGYHTQIIEDVEEVVEESFGYKPSFDEWYFQETGVNTSDLTDEQYDELWADEDLMNHYRKFCDSLDESLNESGNEEVVVGLYGGDEVPGIFSVNELVNYFKSKGLKVSDVSGDMEYGWELNITGSPRDIFFAVQNLNIPGYMSDSVDDFISEYRIDDLDESLNEEYEEDDVLTLYHGTNKELSNIDFLSSKELGLHAGTLEQAQNKGKIIYQIDVDKNTPTLNLHDDLTSGYFSSPEFLILLKNNNIIGDMDFENLYQTLRLYSGEDGENKYKGYSEAYRNFLLNKGFKLIKYPNKAEGSGYSYIILDDSIIKSIKNIDEKSESSESLNESLPKEIKKDIDRIVKTHGAHNIPKWQIQSITQDNPNYSKEIWRYVSDLEYPDNGINEQLESDYYPSEWDTDFEDELENLEIEPQRGVHVGYQYGVPNRRFASKMVKLAKEFGYDDSWVEGNTLYLKWSRPEKEYHKSPYDECLTEDISQVKIPAPYNKYFRVATDTTLEDEGWTYGEEVDGPGCHILALLEPKHKAVEDIYPILVDDPDYPVCEIEAGRLYPVEIPSMDESLTEDAETQKIEPGDCVYLPSKDKYYFVKLKDRGKIIDGRFFHKPVYSLIDENGKVIYRSVEYGSTVWNSLKLHEKKAKPEYALNSWDNPLKGLKEDTIKQNGKWVNKGKEGTHGTFRTKKEADAQRKAMFANGFKG